MNNKNLTTQANDSGNRLTIKDLSVELAELSDEALSQVRGGWRDSDNLPVLPPLGGRRDIIWNPPRGGNSTPPPPVPNPHAP